MAHARVAVFTFRPGTTREVVDRAERELLPIFQRQSGFLAYTLARCGNDKVLSYSLWESRVDAEEANRASAAWVQQNLSRVLVSVERYIGEVAFSHPHIPVHTPSD